MVISNQSLTLSLDWILDESMFIYSITEAPYVAGIAGLEPLPAVKRWVICSFSRSLPSRSGLNVYARGYGHEYLHEYADARLPGPTPLQRRHHVYKPLSRPNRRPKQSGRTSGPPA